MILRSQIISLVLLSFTSLWGAAPTITSELDSRQVLVQESFTWTIEVTGSEQMPSIRLPDIPKVALLSGPMQSSNYSIINGKTSSKKSLSYTFVALEPGRITIPAVEVFLGRKSYWTKPLSLEIVAARQAGGKDGIPRGRNVFLKAIPSKTEVYVGEPLTVRYKLYTKVGVYNYQVDKLPDAVGFWAEEVPQSKQPRLVSEIVNGVRYNTAILKTVLYYPTRSGDLVIDPLKTQLEIEVKSKQRNRRMFNDPFFNDPFFSGSRKATKDFVSDQVHIRVKALPDPKPANYSGAVGHFRFKASLDTTSVFANDAVGLTLTLSGSGNFKSLQLPEPVLPEGVDIFKPERSESIKIKNMQHSGFKKSTYLLVPRSPGKIQIDPIEFTYFDPQTGKYITRSSGPLQLSVWDAEGNQPVVTSGYSREEVALMQEDIRYIKSAEADVRPTGAALFGFRFWGVHLAGVLLLLVLAAYEYRSDRLQANADLKRSVHAMREARKRLKKARKLSEDSAELRTLLHQCITGFIGARLQVAENALDTEGIKTALAERSVDAGLIDQTEQFLEGLTMDRFAPGAVQRSAAEWITVTDQLLKQLGRAL